MSYILTALIGLLIYFYFSIKEKFRYFEKRGIPHTKPKFIFGNTWKNILGLENFNILVNKMYTDFPDKPVFGVFVGTNPFYVIRDPELVAQVLAKEFSHFQNRSIPHNDEVNPLEGHLFFVDGPKWRTLRNKLSPTFTSGKIKGMLPLMEKCADTFMQDLDQHLGQQIDMKVEFSKMAAHVIGSCAFGIETDAIRNPNSDFIKLGIQLIEPGPKEFFLGSIRFLFPVLDKYFKFVTVKPEVHQFLSKMVKDVFEHRKKTGYSRNDFVQLLLELREKGEIETDNREDDEENQSEIPKHHEKIALTDDVLTAQAALFLVAGFDSTSTTLSFTTYLLSKHQDIQDKLRLEIRQIKKKYDGINYESLKDMPYLEAVVNESSRLFPAAGLLIRSCSQDGTVCGGVTIDKGAGIFIPVIGLQKDPNYFPDPEVFKPERFLDTTPIPYTFLPFGEGPRGCIGNRFALLELKLTIAKLVDKYRLDTCPKMAAVEPIKYKPNSFVMAPNDGIFCIVNKI